MPKTKPKPTMQLQGTHLELLPNDSPHHVYHQRKLGSDTLLRLYKLAYSGTKHLQLRSKKWSTAKYYHGTGHCGCLDLQLGQQDGDLEKTEDDENTSEDEPTEDSEDQDMKDDSEDGAESEGESKEDEDDEDDDDEEVAPEPAVHIKVSEWCSEIHCATRGILTHGHNCRFIIRGAGHYFSSLTKVAKSYALTKTGEACGFIDENVLYPLFICKARNVLSSNYRYVASDHDILPCYLAIVRSVSNFESDSDSK
ncbi:hypothetical protein BGZ96_010868 [Linnemannia gamsii]|uniref:Uncharacterized protein n=1 Tax=Linnemannia gamsii TaxID=64522 RepID=A0ABQ7JTJ2_9FUNG|nr:hypothetical protein BGZ96_010868 [Linnemannia gamsii]